MITGLFYECAIRVYGFLIHMASFFLPKAKLWVQGRKEWRRRLTERMASVNRRETRIAWFHAASLGEFEQGRPVIEAFRKEYPGYFILLTFYSPSGYEIRKNYREADYICYLPADTAANARDFVTIVRPEIAFFIKYEFWSNYLKALRHNESFILLFAAIFRQDQIFFKWWGGFFRAVLSRFDVILVQDVFSQQLLESTGAVREVIVAGDTRFDRVEQLFHSAELFPEVRDFVKGQPCLIVGSAWREDMDILIPVFNQLGRKIKAVIAPHEIDQGEIGDWRSSLNLPSVLYSEYKKKGFVSTGQDAAYLIIDNIGMLSALYRYGTMAYVGGAFGKGLHNTLEAVTYGMPVFFGNRNYTRFSEAVSLVESQIATTVGSAADLKGGIVELILDPAILQSRSEAGRLFVSSRKGATDKVMGVLRRFHGQSRNSSSAR